MLFLEYFINFFVIMTCFMQFWAGQERVKNEFFREKHGSPKAIERGRVCQNTLR